MSDGPSFGATDAARLRAIDEALDAAESAKLLPAEVQRIVRFLAAGSSIDGSDVGTALGYIRDALGCNRRVWARLTDAELALSPPKPIDGTGLPDLERATALADAAALTARQVEVVVAELSNTLVPVVMLANMRHEDVREVAREAATRVLKLADAMARRVRVGVPT